MELFSCDCSTLPDLLSNLPVELIRISKLANINLILKRSAAFHMAITLTQIAISPPKPLNYERPDELIYFMKIKFVLY